VNRNQVAFFHAANSSYAAGLIPELQKLVDLHEFDRLPHRFDPSEFAAIVYLIGNAAGDLDIYKAALRHPGIVVLNEPDLHNIVRDMTKDQPEGYLREVFYEIFGQEWDASRDTGLDVTGQQPRTFSMLRRLLDRSRGCIVHSRYAEGAVRMKGFRGKVSRIPHGALVRSPGGAPFRERIAIEKSQPLIGMFSDRWTDEQIYECLGVFRMLDAVEMAAQTPAARMVVATTPAQKSSIEERITELGMAGKVYTLEARSQAEQDGLIAACDLVLDVRWPPSGETSATALRAFGLGKTVVVADHGVAREWPDDICVKIPDGRHRDRVLLESLKWLLSDPQITAEIGSSAARWAADNCAWAHIARLYADFLANPAPQPLGTESLDDDRLRLYLRRWVEPLSGGGRYLGEHESRLIRTLQLTPPGTAGDQILEMGCYLQITPALRNLLGYGHVRGCYFGAADRDLKLVNAQDGEFFECAIDLFNCERDRFPYPDGHFATVLCCELLEHLKYDPMWMMSEIHRILRPGGILLLTTPNIVSLRSVRAVLRGRHPGFYNRYPDPQADRASNPRHEREYTPGEISLLLEAAGFAVDHIETCPYAVPPESEPESPGAGQEEQRAANLLDSLKQPLNLRDDCILALGRRESLLKDLRPAWLYDSATFPAPGNTPTR
jgi:SAM-dependent methyltransferase